MVSGYRRVTSNLADAQALTGSAGLPTLPLTLAGLVAMVPSGHTAKCVSPDLSGGGAYERGVRLTLSPG